MSSQGGFRGYKPGGYSGGGGGKNLASHKDVPLPPHFQCRICNKVKSNNLYSKKEQLVYKNKVFNGGAIGPMHYRLCCRGCAGSPGAELYCKGPCSMWKSLDDFSKTQRLNPETSYCLLCMDWKLSAEPGLPAQPAPYEPTFGEGVPTVKVKDNNEESGDEDDGMPEHTNKTKSKKTKTKATPATSTVAAEGILIDVGSSTHGTTTTGKATPTTATGSTAVNKGNGSTPGTSGFVLGSGAPGPVASRKLKWPKVPREKPTPRAPKEPLSPVKYFPPVEEYEERTL